MTEEKLGKLGRGEFLVEMRENFIETDKDSEIFHKIDLDLAPDVMDKEQEGTDNPETSQTILNTERHARRFNGPWKGATNT